MNIENYLTNPNRITADVILSARTELDNLQENTINLCRDYLNDVDIKRSRIDAQAERYAAELTAMEVSEKQLASQISQSVVQGDLDEVTRLENELDALEGRINGLKKKQSLMNGVTVQGDPDLYTACKSAMGETDAEAEKYRQALENLKIAAAKEADRLSKVSEEIGRVLGVCSMYGYTRPNFAGSAHAEFTKVERHYRDLDRIEAEEKHRRNEQRMKEQEEQKHKGCSFTFA